MKKTFYTYILREQLTPVFICLAGACFVLITGQLLQLMRILFASSCSLKDIVEIVLFALPRLISYAAPMAALLGVMLAFVRLNSDNELVAFRAAGIGFLGFLPPVLGVLVFATVLSFINAIYVMPVTNHAFQVKLRSLGRNSVPALLKEGVFISAIPNLVLFFRSVDHSDLSIKGVFIQDQRQPKEKVTIASRDRPGRYSAGLQQHHLQARRRRDNSNLPGPQRSAGRCVQKLRLHTLDGRDHGVGR